MTKYSCSVSECTVAVTGKCLRSHVPVEGCPDIRLSDIEPETPDPTRSSQATATVYPGNELGLQQTISLMSARYGILVGVLGAIGTGKTCLLSSLYLLASCGDLRPSFVFAGSLTLPGFENRLRLLRKWSGDGLPEQIVDHTVLADPRQPGFLHLAFQVGAPKHSTHDVFFTDLPGEWTSDLIKHADAADRLQFLQRADAVVITLPGAQLLAPETRNSQIQYCRLLLHRLRDSVGLGLGASLILAITRCDVSGIVTPPAIYQLIEAAQQLGFGQVSHLPIAAFSDREAIPSGLGVASILETIFAPQMSSPIAIPTCDSGSRMFARFRLESGSEA